VPPDGPPENVYILVGCDFAVPESSEQFKRFMDDRTTTDIQSTWQKLFLVTTALPDLLLS